MLIPVSLLLVCLVGFFMLKQVNLFLGVEKQVTLDVISTEQIGKGPGRRFAMAFKDKWGGHFRQTFQPALSKRSARCRGTRLTR